MNRRSGRGGFSSFLLIWFGQSVSLVGSSLTGFALGVWVYQRSGSLLAAFLYPHVRHVDTELPDFAAAGPHAAVP